MNYKELQDHIITEIEPTITDLKTDIDLVKCIKHYFAVLDYESDIPRADNLKGLSSTKRLALRKAIMDQNYDRESISQIGTFNQKFEAFIKKLYVVLEDLKFIREDNRVDTSIKQTISPYLKSLNRVNIYYHSNTNHRTIDINNAKKDNFGKPVLFKNKGGDFEYKRLYKSSLSLNVYDNPDSKELKDRYEGSFLYHFYRAYILRNEEAHQAKHIRTIDAIQNLYSTLITELLFIDFFRQKLENLSRLIETGKTEFNDYIDKELNRVSQQMKRFVPLSLLPYSLTEGGSQPREVFKVEPLRLRILGEGGSGKTTTIENILYVFCEKWKKNETEKIPILVFLANLNDGETIISAASKKVGVDISIIEELLETNKIVLLLDGVNEITNNREIKRARLKEISSIISSFPELEIIISDRYDFDSYQNDPFDLPSFGIQKLNEQQIKEFVDMYTLDSNVSPKKVLNIIEDSHKIKDLLKRPLLISRAVEIIKVDNNLPNREGEIIERFIDIMLKREKDEKKDPLLNIRDFKLLLSYVANNINEEFNANKPIDELKFHKIINVGAKELGLEDYNAGYTSRVGFELEILSKKDSLLQFYHQSYFDFFVALYTRYELQ